MGVSPPGARPRSDVAYYVVLAGILALLFMLLLYFAYFCIKRVKELVQQDCSSQTHISARPPQPTTATYPVQPVVRDSASAMAKLCRQLPAPTPVYPAASSPAATRTEQALPQGPDKTPAPPAAAIPRIEIDTVDAR